MEESTAGGRTVTLKDLANELGIHPSTVSRILHSGSEVARGAASVATAERVRELARKRGYSPDPQAAGLRTRRTRLMGVIVPPAFGPRSGDYVRGHRRSRGGARLLHVCHELPR